MLCVMCGASALWLVAAGLPAQAGADPVAYKTETGISYRTGRRLSAHTRDRCRLDLYYPEGAQGFSTVVWFHGGGLTGGERGVPEGLKNRGIAVVAAGYRLSPTGRSPQYVEDAAAAVAWVVRNIARYGGSAQNVFVSGHSAGGYLAAMVGLDRRWLAAHRVDADTLAGIAPLSGQMITHFTVRRERGISDTRPVIDDMAPLYHVRKDAPPMLLVTGDREKEMLGRYEENAYAWRMLRVVGHPDAELHELSGYDHGSMVEPAMPLLLRFVERCASGTPPPAHSRSR